MRSKVLACLIFVTGVWASGYQIGFANQIVLELNQGMLRPIGLSVVADKTIADVPAAHPLGYRRLEFAGLSPQSLRISAPGGAIDAFAGGELQYHARLEFQVADQVVDLDNFRLDPDPDEALTLRLLDGNGIAWLRLDHGHFELTDSNSLFELRHANLSISRHFAQTLGQSELEGLAIGTAHLRAPVMSMTATTGEMAMGESQCSEPNWPGESDFEADVALTGLGRFNIGAQQMRCSDCNGIDSGTVVVATDATLHNEGSADVPWWRQFSDPQPPYGNDQHPFLVWNFYRLSASGVLEQIGVSGVKHAFYSINQGCPCAGGNILWTGCGDNYSASTNDESDYLAPRNEVLPFTGQWGRCESRFDPDCSSQQTVSGDDGYANRLRLAEVDLNSFQHPGARYFIEAWYVVRDDVDIFNTMGWREVTPAWNGSIWTFAAAGDMVQGPLIEAWPDFFDEPVASFSSLVETGEGRARVSVVVTPAEAGRFRYDHVVMNHELTRATTSGQEPDLEIETSTGFSAFSIPLRPDTVITGIDSARADRNTGQNWPGQRQGDELRWDNPGDTPLNWGRAFRFSILASGAPEPATGALEVDQSPSGVFYFPTLAPGSDRLFGDGFGDALENDG